MPQACNMWVQEVAFFTAQMREMAMKAHRQGRPPLRYSWFVPSWQRGGTDTSCRYVKPADASGNQSLGNVVWRTVRNVMGLYMAFCCT